MKKLGKILFVLAMLLCVTFVASCEEKHEHAYVEGVCECGEKDPNYVDPIVELETAMAELETATYTANMDAKVSMTMKQGSQSTTQEVIMNMYMESDATQVYTVSTIDEEKQYSYTIIDGEFVKQYFEYDGEWMLLDTTSLEDYSDTADLFDIEVKDAFTLNDGVWVGNVEVLSEALSKTMEKMSEELVGMGGTMEETSIKKYNITLVDGKVSKMDVEMYMKMTAEGYTIEISYSMPMNISKIGQTTVTVPKNLPVE